jgi:hypothetical protein
VKIHPRRSLRTSSCLHVHSVAAHAIWRVNFAKVVRDGFEVPEAFYYPGDLPSHTERVHKGGLASPGKLSRQHVMAGRQDCTALQNCQDAATAELLRQVFINRILGESSSARNQQQWHMCCIAVPTQLQHC